MSDVVQHFFEIIPFHILLGHPLACGYRYPDEFELSTVIVADHVDGAIGIPIVKNEAVTHNSIAHGLNDGVSEFLFGRLSIIILGTEVVQMSLDLRPDVLQGWVCILGVRGEPDHAMGIWVIGDLHPIQRSSGLAVKAQM